MAAVPAAVALFVTGCASAGESGGAEASAVLSDGMVNVVDGGEPVRGGGASFGSYSEPASLDPAVTITSVTTGGAEMVNIYDSLMRLDSDAQEFVPQMAAGLEHDADFRTWTLTLRDGVAFSNGKPVDAAAVKASQERYAAKPAPEAALWKDSVVGITTPDDKTVVYELNKTWAEFPGLLTTGPGMIVSTDSDGADGKFTPIGAGPFTLDKWSQAESMLLNANPSYWAGEPNLDTLTFVYLPSTTVGQETFFNGGIDATFVREPNEIQQALDRGVSGYMNLTAAANAAVINAAEGRPGADPRLRKAMQLAIDTDIINERAFGNTNKSTNMIFSEGSRWHTETPGPQVDVEEATRLVDAAKADGYDGQLEVIDASDPASLQTSLAVEAQLEAVGFDVQVNNLPTIGDQIRTIAAERDYDIAAWGLSFREADPYPKMFATMHSAGKQVYGMYTSPEMDALIEQVQTEPDADAKLQILDKIQQQVNKDAPYLVYGDFSDFIIWNANMHGILGSSNSLVLFGQAWKTN
ncbi:ABC transporter substrate-binding protein [Tomitella biformata]|uniref:ABC transporter substrate-binding protein n=1 Tax=Tomitella biformata TaxID=630403 RepID=UPI00130E136F|nr:ABC transporter substrate-binding protein [Tomitella biformata]